MKTKTILNAYIRVRDMRYGCYLRRDRQNTKFRAALLRRIEAGDRAREALLDVEWVMHREDGDICPWCYANKHWEGHAPDCPRQIALGISNVAE